MQHRFPCFIAFATLCIAQSTYVAAMKENDYPFSKHVMHIIKTGGTTNQIDFNTYLNKTAPRETRITKDGVVTKEQIDTRAQPEDIKKANTIYQKCNKGSRNLFHLMAYHGNKKALITLLEILEDGLLTTDKNGNTPLFYALQKNDASLTQWFLYGQRYFTKADISHKNNKQMSTLWYAIKYEAADCVQVILDNGFFLNKEENIKTYKEYAQNLDNENPSSKLKKIIELLHEETNLVAITKKHFLPLKEYSHKQKPFLTKLAEYLNSLTTLSEEELEIILQAEEIYKTYRQGESFADLLGEYFIKLGEKKCLQYLKSLNSDKKDKEDEVFSLYYLAAVVLNTLGYDKKSNNAPSLVFPKSETKPNSPETPKFPELKD